MKANLEKAIKNQSEKELIKCLDLKRRFKIHKNQYDLVVVALSSTWHSQHEDLVNKLISDQLQDDRFVQPILSIALDKETFRWFDDELESTLRKCVHALKMINSKESNKALIRLEKLQNDNVKFALELYE
ncbi:hypothetical protein GYB29_07495 [bacterium]|nr:hypothetical protein [bacterium]